MIDAWPWSTSNIIRLTKPASMMRVRLLAAILTLQLLAWAPTEVHSKPALDGNSPVYTVCQSRPPSTARGNKLRQSVSAARFAQVDCAAHLSVVHTSKFSPVAKYSLTSHICSCGRRNKPSFSLTSLLVETLACQLFNKETFQGKNLPFFVKENLSRRKRARVEDALVSALS